MAFGVLELPQTAALRHGVPLAFQLADLDGPADLLVELVVAEHLALGDRVVDDVVDAGAGLMGEL
ncbi:MAG: hypothetical protein AVDCRST_MAG64-2522 [uncultured Phycisphaerae bacterium]|uniref:Uncharacterized protein n=1 Tax=uncultured Phycisphaerae bacterium TaxID=904963 RepID=A0A6J4PH16_9BACT|nr:MAG: hypothetical protein AVDCRST_MAG64-2522 [uncultured Phycisphaerae bacterium]